MQCRPHLLRIIQRQPMMTASRVRWGAQTGDRHRGDQAEAGEAPADKPQPDDPEADAAMRAWIDRAKWGQGPG